MKLLYEYMVIFFNSSPTSSHLYPLQAENCDSNSRLVVDKDDNVKSGLKGLNPHDTSKHHFSFLMNNLISYTARGFKTKFFKELFNNTNNFSVPVHFKKLYATLSPGADSENLDFVAPPEEHRFYGIFCFLVHQLPFLKHYPF